MNATDILSWQQANQRYLSAALVLVREALNHYLTGLQGKSVTANQSSELQKALLKAAGSLPAPSALENLCAVFGLTSFERDVLLLCAGLELDSAFPPLCADAQGDPRRTYATFSLALAALPDAHWSAIMPESPLRYWRLIEVVAGDVLSLSPLRIDERVLHYLTGISCLDARLQGIVEPLALPRQLPPSHNAIAQQIVRFWGEQPGMTDWTAIQLCGGEAASQAAIAASACTLLGLKLQRIRATDIPVTVAEREALNRLWEREALLSNSALLLDCEASDSADRERAIRSLDRLRCPLIVTGREPLRTRQRSLLRLEVNSTSLVEQQALWQEALGSLAEPLNGQIEPLALQFNLNPQQIQAACWELKLKHQDFKHSNERPENNTQVSLLYSLWDTCRVQARSRLDDLAQRIEPTATWDDLVLPQVQCQTLREIAANVRQRVKVYETWGFACKGARGLGISALFAGMSGTGKTMAAEVLAHELRLDLYRIDLSSVVSKYIGETEKNLRRVFDAAESGGAILLFDEADALFGKRSEVKDSHDRYANIEVSYLLQRMEAYRGLAVLTTNLKSALDKAFWRRIRFIVQFPFPDAVQRTEIWRRIFPANAPTEGLDAIKLGRLNVAGGNIRNIALNAAFLAADAEESVQMKHLLAAARSEYTKLEKSLTEAEIGGWV